MTTSVLDFLVATAEVVVWPGVPLAGLIAALAGEQVGAIRSRRLRALNCGLDRYLPRRTARRRELARLRTDAGEDDLDDGPGSGGGGDVAPTRLDGRGWWSRHFWREPLHDDVRRLWSVTATSILVLVILCWPLESGANPLAIVWAGVKIVTWATQAAGGIYVLYQMYKATSGGNPGDATLTPLIIDMLAQLQAVRSGFGIEGYRYLSQSMAKLFPIISVLFILWNAGKMMLFTDSAKECLGKMIGRLPLMTVVGLLLAWPAVYHDYVIALIEGLALSIGALFIQVGYALPELLGTGGKVPLPPMPSGGISYGYLGGLMTNSIADVIDIAFLMMTSGWEAVFGGALAGLILLLPYTFVVGVFIAFMVESMFKVLAMWAVTPLLLCGTLFDSTKSFWVASLRVMLSAGLTVVFACAAMGFTVGVIETNRSNIVCKVVGEQHAKCQALKAGKGADGGLTGADKRGAKISGEDAGLPIGSSSYYYTLILGFVSVLLHLKAASLASNISGANDGAGPAAAVVMAGQAALGFLGRGAMQMATMRTGIGKKAFGNSEGDLSPDMEQKIIDQYKARLAGKSGPMSE